MIFFMKHSDLQAEIDRLIQSTNVDQLDHLFGLSASIQQRIMASPVPPDLEKAILDQYRLLEEEAGDGVRVALRSSALGEDMPGTSFAGQYRSELNVSRENLLEAYKNVVASKYSLTAMTYRLNRGIRDEEVAMGVGCMQMVDAVSGGVMYSRNPLDIRDDGVVINSLWGLPKAVVDGSAATDLFVVSRGDSMAVRERAIPVKDQKFVCYPEEGVCRLDVTGEESRSASLTDDQAKELARLAVRIEAYYQRPQDIEWAVDRAGSVVILQCRPLLQKAESAKSRLEAKDEGRARVLLKGGVTAGSGVGSGPVFIARKDMDALQFPAGGVLVAEQSLPRWATLLSRAAAVVTEQGSIAGHLANVSREFGVPALFGVDGAMTGLENGRTVTVDADGLRIYDGRVEALLVQTEKPRNLMEGSPVFDALKGAAEQIIPLHLLDPDAPCLQSGAVQDVSRRHEVLSREIRSGDVSVRERASVPGAFQQTAAVRSAHAVVGSESGRRLSGGSGRTIREAREHRLHSHARPVGRDHGQTVGRAAACGWKRIDVRHVRGHEKHGSCYGWRFGLWREELFHHFEKLLQPQFKARLSFLDCGRAGE